MEPSSRILVFGKLPRAGYAKTRLAPVLGAEGAACLYQAFLDDTVQAVRSVAGARAELWVPGTPEGLEPFEARYPGLPIRTQRGDGLGARLHDAFDRTFAGGADYALVIGSDHPTLPIDYLRRGLKALKGAHLVIGPTCDGGYYLLGLRRHAWPGAGRLFEAIPWSTERVLEVTRERARATDLCHVELPEWYDVDRPEDLPRLRADVDPASRTAAALAPSTVS